MKTGNFNAKKIVVMAMLIAISIILTRFASFYILNNTVRLGFGNMPIIYSGLLLGPFAGAIVGVLSDILGMLIMPAGAYHPGFTLSAALCGFIPGLFMHWMGKKWHVVTISNTFVCIFILIGLNTLWLSQIFGKAYIALLPGRVVASLIITVINILIITILIKRTKHLV